MHCKRLCTVPFHFRGKLTFMVNYGKEIVFLYDDESLLRKENFGITGNA